MCQVELSRSNLFNASSVVSFSLDVDHGSPLPQSIFGAGMELVLDELQVVPQDAHVGQLRGEVNMVSRI